MKLKEMNKPYTPLEQLKMVLPVESHNLIRDKVDSNNYITDSGRVSYIKKIFMGKLSFITYIYKLNFIFINIFINIFIFININISFKLFHLKYDLYSIE